MNTELKWLAAALAGAALVTLAGCGGSPGSAAADGSTSVATTVIDGAIRNALVCLDKNLNGECDAGEPSGRTDASGNLTLVIDKADAGKYPLVTVVGTDAVDADNGPVTEPFTMRTTPGKPGVISPLTTMVAQAMENGATQDQAESLIKEQTGISVSLFEDFTKVAAPTSGPKPGDVARMIVVTTQEQGKALQASIGAQAIDGSTISGNDLKRAVQRKIMQILPQIAQASIDNNGITDQKTKEAAILNAVKTTFMDANALKTDIGIAKQATAPDPNAAPTAGISLDSLNFTNTNNWFRRVFSATLAQATPDATGWRKVVDRRQRMASGNLANWNFGTNPSDQSDLHWNGTAWVNFSLNQEWQATVPDASGNNQFNYMDKFNTGNSKRAVFPLDGKPMAALVQQVVDAGYTNVTIANAATALGSATFPAGSTITYLQSTDATTSWGYYPGTGNTVFNYSAGVSAGGDSRTQSAGVNCNATEFQSGPGIQTATLEDMVNAYKGLPCLFNQSSFTANATTYYEGGVQNAAFVTQVWSNSTMGIGTIGTVALGSAPTGFYTGNKLIRVGFQGSGTNPVTYYTCEQRFINGSVRACTSIGTGTYTVTALADGSRVMTLSNPPATALTFNRVFVERNGKIYFGFQNKLGVRNQARLNTAGANALFTQLGMPTVDADVPMPLTAGSYAGTWDIREPAFPFAFNVGTRLVLNNDGTVACFDNSNAANLMTCTLNISDPSTGAFNATSSTGGILAGAVNFTAGTISGTFSNPGQSIPPGTPFVGQRR